MVFLGVGTGQGKLRPRDRPGQGGAEVDLFQNMDLKRVLLLMCIVDFEYWILDIYIYIY